MGTWGPGPFENDCAWDYLGEIEDPDPAVRTTVAARFFDDVASDPSYLQVDDGQSVVALAALMVLHLPDAASATLVARPPQFPEGVTTIDVNDGLCSTAVRALDRIMADDSELAQLWDGDEVFVATVAQIRNVLTRPSPNSAQAEA